MSPGAGDLPARVHAAFARIVDRLRAHGVPISPDLELRAGEGVFCWCDLDDGHIYVSLPVATDPTAKLKLLFLRTLLGCDSEASLLEALDVILPWILAHELGHHCRWYSKTLTADRWLEEQVANRFASAIAKHDLTADAFDRARGMLTRAFQSLCRELGRADEVTRSFDDVLRSLAASGALSEGATREVDRIAAWLGLSPEALLRAHGTNFSERERIIRDFNDGYTSDVVRYFACQIGWWLTDLESPDHQYLDALVSTHLTAAGAVLPVPSDPNLPSDAVIRAWFTASVCSEGTVSRWFYKRYRRGLLRRIEDAEPTLAARGVPRGLLEWPTADGDDDGIDLLEPLVATSLRPMFPAALRATAHARETVGSSLLEETDRRLWGVAGGGVDAAATRALVDIEALDRTSLFRALPAEVMLELTHIAWRVHAEPGDVLIHRGRRNYDVWLVVDGSLAVEGADGAELLTLGPGDPFGEMSFFTERPRSATVRAKTAATCLVLQAPALRRLGHAHASVFAQMARTLALRLEARR